MHSVPTATELDEVRAILAGDRAAFDAFYDAWFPRVYAHLARNAGAARAESLTRQAMSQLVATLASLPSGVRVSVWVYAHVRGVLSGRAVPADRAGDRIPAALPVPG